MRLPTEAQNIALRQTVRDLPDNPSPIDPVYYVGNRIPKLPEIPEIPKPEKLLTHVTYGNDVILHVPGFQIIFLNHGPLTGTYTLRSIVFYWHRVLTGTFSWDLRLADSPLTNYIQFYAHGQLIFTPPRDQLVAGMETNMQSFHYENIYRTLRMSSDYLCLRLYSLDAGTAPIGCSYMIALQEIP